MATMSIAPPQTGFAQPRTSPLNPQSLPLSRSLRLTNIPDNRTHLSNLDLVLLKKSPPPPPLQQLTLDRRSIGHTDNDKNTGGIFDTLNLNTILPSLRNSSTNAMSPRSLKRLQRLLSSSRPSPKKPIASTWHRLHGSTNWEGLLDPLDENLRRELVRYGDLIQSAYHTFLSKPDSPQRPQNIILPDRNYKVTKSLYATSSVELPKWVTPVAPRMTRRSSWIGYVAVCDKEKEIRRMGRRDIVVALRGTATCLEWAENFRTNLVPVDGEDGSKVANGFLSLYKTSAGAHVSSLSGMVVEEIRRLTELYKGEELSITITGHSLGGALAQLVADEISTCLTASIAVFSFGGPKVGNKAFGDRLKRKGVKVLRVANSNDVVTRVPGVLPRRIGYAVDGYVHLGAELKVDSQSSPYLKPDADPNCCHDLESYLHLVDGFVSRESPFRSDSKRGLSRLFELHRPNLKKLCVNQAQAMGFDRSTSEVGCLPSPSR